MPTISTRRIIEVVPLTPLVTTYLKSGGATSSVLAGGITGQYQYPSVDIVTTGWVPTPSSPTTLYDKLNELAPNDSNYISATTTTQTPVVNLELSSTPHPNLIGGSEYGLSTYGVGEYGGSSEVTLNVRAKKANTTDIGTLTVWLYEGSVLRDGPFVITLTNSFTTYSFNVQAASDILNWSNVNIQLQGAANPGSSLSSQISWIDLISPLPALGVVPKVGGGISSAAVAGGIRNIQGPKTGGGKNQVIAGTAKKVTATKTGGTITQAIAGGSKSTSSPSQTTYSKSGGVVGNVIAGGGRGTPTAKTGGIVSQTIAGGNKLVLSTHVGGGLSKAVTGAVKGTLQIRIGGTLSTAIAGLSSHLLRGVKSGGGILNPISGEVKLITYRKTGGGIAGTAAGGSKSKVGIVTFISKIGGSIGFILSGVIKQPIYIKTAGAIASSKAGLIELVSVSRSGGAISYSVSGGIKIYKRIEIGGGIATSVTGGSYFYRTKHNGGAISNAVGGGKKGYTSNKKGGSTGPAKAGGTKSKIIITVYKAQFGGATSVVFGGVRKKSISQKTAGIQAAPIGGGNQTSTIVERGGAITGSLAGGTHLYTPKKFAGGKSLVVSGGLIYSAFGKSGGITSILKSGTVIGSIIVNISRQGGAISYPITGAPFASTTIDPHGAAISKAVAGGVLNVQYHFETLGPRPTPILSAKFSF